MKVKVAASFDGGKIEITMDRGRKAIIVSSGKQNVELETFMLATVYQIFERLGVK